MKKLRQPTSLGCFACGRNNPFGLHLEWFNNYEAKQVEATFQLNDNFSSKINTLSQEIQSNTEKIRSNIQSSGEQLTKSIYDFQVSTAKSININRWIMIVGIILLAALHFILK